MAVGRLLALPPALRTRHRWLLLADEALVAGEDLPAEEAPLAGEDLPADANVAGKHLPPEEGALAA